jgi:cysteine desulfurase / selenocysteine lyase
MKDVASLREDFPNLNIDINSSPLVYLDTAATSHKPIQVIESLKLFYSEQNANVHRGLHTLSQNATKKFEAARTNVASFLNVQNNEIVWTSGATESINIVAHGLSAELNENDIILVSEIEHHANIVPWQQLAKITGALLKVIPADEHGIISLESIEEAIHSFRPKVLAITHASNTLGNIHDIKAITKITTQYNCYSVIDGAQAFLHLRPNLKDLDCDFYVFSAHKALGPTGLGVLYGKYEKLKTLLPYKYGGEMIETVSFNGSTFALPPAKFEAGTPNIAAAIAFSCAIDYLRDIDQQDLIKYEQKLFQLLLEGISSIKGIKMYGDRENNIGTLSFNYKQEHHFDIATLLDGYGIAVRTGSHCTQPLMNTLNLNGTIRISLAFYNNPTDIKRFLTALKDVISLLED